MSAHVRRARPGSAVTRAASGASTRPAPPEAKAATTNITIANDRSLAATDRAGGRHPAGLVISGLEDVGSPSRTERTEPFCGFANGSLEDLTNEGSVSPEAVVSRDYSGDGHLTTLDDWPAASVEHQCILAGDEVFLRGPKADYGDGQLRHPIFIKPKGWVKKGNYVHRPAPKLTNIYFIASDAGPIKIGMAERVPVRLRALQLGCPVKLRVLVTVSGPPEREREYHRQFAAHRLHGEWFAPAPEILAEIERLRTAGEGAGRG